MKLSEYIEIMIDLPREYLEKPFYEISCTMTPVGHIILAHRHLKPIIYVCGRWEYMQLVDLQKPPVPVTSKPGSASVINFPKGVNDNDKK